MFASWHVYMYGMYTRTYVYNLAKGVEKNFMHFRLMLQNLTTKTGAHFYELVNLLATDRPLQAKEKAIPRTNDDDDIKSIFADDASMNLQVLRLNRTTTSVWLKYLQEHISIISITYLHKMYVWHCKCVYFNEFFDNKLTIRGIMSTFSILSGNRIWFQLIDNDLTNFIWNSCDACKM